MSVKHFCDRCGLACEPRRITISWQNQETARTLDLCSSCYDKAERFLNSLWTDRIQPVVKEH